MDDFTERATEGLQAQRLNLAMRRQDLKERREEIPSRSETGARAVNIGFLLERLAPTLNEFGFEPGDCRALGDPIDYVIFEGLGKTGKVRKVILADVKTGEARLTGRQLQICGAVQAKKVSLQTYTPKRSQ